MSFIVIMATTGIWKIEKNLNQVIDYVSDNKKTLNPNYNNSDLLTFHKLSQLEDYSSEKKYYVSSINCSMENVFEDMSITKKRFNKRNGILGYHAYQSFKENEVTPEQAHEIGIKFAQEVWGDRFEVVIATHLNTNHIHNHFVINSVSFLDGKKFYDNRSTYSEMRHINDSVCQEYNLSVLEEKTCKKSRINYGNYYKKTIEYTNYYTITKQNIDRAIEQAYSFQDFLELLKVMDYQVKNRYGKLSICRAPYKKNIRIERSFGEEYSIDNLKKRIETTNSTRIPFLEVYGNRNEKSSYRPYCQKKKKGIASLYIHYCYLLKVIPRKHPRMKIPADIRNDIQEMDNISKETRLLVENKIETYSQFLSYQMTQEKLLDQWLDEREKLWYRYKKSTLEEKLRIRSKITLLSKKIQPLRSKVELCGYIQNRISNIENKINQFDNKFLQSKESDRNESIRRSSRINY